MIHAIVFTGLVLPRCEFPVENFYSDLPFGYDSGIAYLIESYDDREAIHQIMQEIGKRERGVLCQQKAS